MRPSMYACTEEWSKTRHEKGVGHGGAEGGKGGVCVGVVSGGVCVCAYVRPFQGARASAHTFMSALEGGRPCSGACALALKAATTPAHRSIQLPACASA